MHNEKFNKSAFNFLSMSSASELERGKYFLLNNEPVRVVRKEVVVCGTHSHSKLKLFVQGLKTKGERSINLGHNDKVEILDLIRKTGQVLSKTENKIQVMDSFSYETLDPDADKELHDQLKEGDEVIFVDYQGIAQIIDKK